MRSSARTHHGGVGGLVIDEGASRAGNLDALSHLLQFSVGCSRKIMESKLMTRLAFHEGGIEIDVHREADFGSHPLVDQMVHSAAIVNFFLP